MRGFHPGHDQVEAAVSERELALARVANAQLSKVLRCFRHLVIPGWCVVKVGGRHSRVPDLLGFRVQGFRSLLELLERREVPP